MLSLTITNTGVGAIDPDPGMADYRYTVCINGKEIAYGAVKHERRQGWPALVAAIAQQESTGVAAVRAVRAKKRERLVKRLPIAPWTPA